MSGHVIQSPQWSEFKSKYGTSSIKCGEIYYTKHAIPFTGNYYAYCPKVDPSKIDFIELEKSLKANNCIAINFDVPNVLADDPKVDEYKKMFEQKCVKAYKDTFAKNNVLLDLTPSEEDLQNAMHTKHRYNIKLSLKHDVYVKFGETDEDFEVFYKLLSDTAVRQKYFVHPKQYYKLIWDTFRPQNIVRLVTAYKDKTPLASWMLFLYEGVMYYPYGGSSMEYRNLAASTLVAWEAIKMGKRDGCKLFDMWGAAKDPKDQSDSWFGFTQFKLRFGGQFVKYMDSYDFVLNEVAYNAFNLANDLRWKILRFIR